MNNEQENIQNRKSLKCAFIKNILHDELYYFTINRLTILEIKYERRRIGY